MDFELKAAKAKWEREQREKVERARARQQREQKVKEDAARQQQALEEAQRLRRIEAAEAALAVQQQEQEDLQLGDGIRYKRILRGFRIPGDGDKVTLPADDFEVLSSQNALDKGPMFFEISSASPTIAALNRRSTHGGVLEFTAPEGFVGLPPHVWKNLTASGSAEEEIMVRIRYERLPKGRYVKLQPEGRDFAEIPDHKVVLESKLRHHAALSEGDILSVQYGGLDYELRVLELQPASAVTVLETDIEADVVSKLSQNQAQDDASTILQLTLGMPQSGTVEEGSYRFFKFVVNHHLAEATSRGDTEIAIQLQIEGSNSDADVYVAAHPVLYPSRDEHQWASYSTGRKFISMTSVASGTYSIAVYGFRGTSSFTLLAEAAQVSGKVSGQKLGAASVQEQRDGYKCCGNCKQWIPIQAATLHELYCARNNLVCEYPGCGAVFRREDAKEHVHCSRCGLVLRDGDLQKHMDVFHVSHSCSCGAVLEMQEMVNHKATACPHRKITCRFCGDIVESGGDCADMRDRLRGLSDHESRCGSRTDQCDICHRAVMLKEMDLHREAVHAPGVGIKTQTTVSPVAEVSSIAATSAGAAAERMEATAAAAECPICGGAFDGLEALNLHFNDHMDEAAVNHPPKTTAEAPSASNFRQSLLIQCPICGMAVHSERDLSSHFDMVH